MQKLPIIDTNYLPPFKRVPSDNTPVSVTSIL